MKKLLLLLAVTLVGLTSCEERLDRLDEINLQQNIQIDILKKDLNALTQSVNDEIARVEQIIAAVDAENDAALIEGLSAAQAELSAAVALLAQADTDNLVAALSAVAAAEETLVAVIADNLSATQAALAALGSTDADLLAQIADVLNAIATLEADLLQTDVDLNKAITDASNLLAAADALIQTQVNELSDVVKQQIVLMEADGFRLVDGSNNTWIKTTGTGIRRVFLSSGGKFYPSVEIGGVVYDKLGGRATFAGVLDAFLKFNIVNVEIANALADYELPASQVSSIVSQALNAIVDVDVTVTGVSFDAVTGELTIHLSDGNNIVEVLENVVNESFTESQIALFKADGFVEDPTLADGPVGTNGNARYFTKTFGVNKDYAVAIFRLSEAGVFSLFIDNEFVSGSSSTTYAKAMDALQAYFEGK